MEDKIILYSTGCPQCKVLTNLLDGANITYEHCSDIKAMRSIGILSVPMLRVNGDLRNFPSAMRWVKEVCHEN